MVKLFLSSNNKLCKLQDISHCYKLSSQLSFDYIFYQSSDAFSPGDMIDIVSTSSVLELGKLSWTSIELSSLVLSETQSMVVLRRLSMDLRSAPILESWIENSLPTIFQDFTRIQM